MKHLNLELEKLEQRIAPGVMGGGGSNNGTKEGSGEGSGEGSHHGSGEGSHHGSGEGSHHGSEGSR